MKNDCVINPLWSLFFMLINVSPKEWYFTTKPITPLDSLLVSFVQMLVCLFVGEYILLVNAHNNIISKERALLSNNMNQTQRLANRSTTKERIRRLTVYSRIKVFYKTGIHSFFQLSLWRHESGMNITARHRFLMKVG